MNRSGGTTGRGVGQVNSPYAGTRPGTGPSAGGGGVITGGMMGARHAGAPAPNYASLGGAQQAQSNQAAPPTQPPEPALQVTQYMVDQIRIQVLMYAIGTWIIGVCFMTLMMFMTGDAFLPRLVLTLAFSTWGIVGCYTIARAWRVFLARIMVIN